MGNCKYRSDKIIKLINSSSSRMETLLEGSTISTITSNIINDYDYGVNETYDYHDEIEVVVIYYYYATEKIRSIIDRINQERVSEMIKKRNLTVGYHGRHINILPPLLKFTKVTCNNLIDDLLIGNKRYNIPPYCLLTHYHFRHLQTKKCNNSGHNMLIKMESFVKVIEKHTREANC